ncbi:MAG: zinc ABC transporter substrate-binding protein, partial [Sulfurovum sp.]
FYTNNYNEFIKELEQLDHEIHEILEPYEHKEFMVFHPSWGYFAKRYHLEQLAIEVQGKEPKPNELIKIIDDAKKHNIKIVFVAPQFAQNSAKTISKNINGTVTVINPLSQMWDKELLKTAREIANSYK